MKHSWKSCSLNSRWILGAALIALSMQAGVQAETLEEKAQTKEQEWRLEGNVKAFNHYYELPKIIRTSRSNTRTSRPSSRQTGEGFRLRLRGEKGKVLDETVETIPELNVLKEKLEKFGERVKEVDIFSHASKGKSLYGSSVTLDLHNDFIRDKYKEETVTKKEIRSLDFSPDCTTTIHACYGSSHQGTREFFRSVAPKGTLRTIEGLAAGYGDYGRIKGRTLMVIGKTAIAVPFTKPDWDKDEEKKD